jgi:hypothetical protein
LPIVPANDDLRKEIDALFKKLNEQLKAGRAAHASIKPHKPPAPEGRHPSRRRP